MTDPLTPLEVMRAALEHGTPRAPNSILHRIEQMGYTIVPSAARADTAALDVERLARALIQSGMYLDADDPLVGLEPPKVLARTIAREYAALEATDD